MVSKAKLIIRGTTIRVIYFFSTVITGLFLMPYMIHSLGDEMYGLWMFIFSLVGFYVLFDMGLSSATQRYVSQAIGKDDFKEANVVINTSFFLFMIIGFLVLIVLLVSVYAIPLIIKNITKINLFRTVMLILGINLALSIPMKVFSGVLVSHLRFDIQAGVELLKLLLRTFFIILFLMFGKGIIIIALIFVILDLFGYLMIYKITKKIAPYMTLKLEFFDKTKIKKLYSYSWKTFIIQMGDQFRFNIDNAIITCFMGLNFVTIYSIAARLISHFTQFIWSSAGFMAPIFSQYESRNDYNLIKEKFIFTTKITSYLTILIGGVLIIFGKAFIERWLGKDYLLSYPILIVLVIGMIPDLMLIQTVSVLYGISKHKFLAVLNIAEGLLNLILSIILVQKYGLIGVAMGTTIPMLITKIFIQPIYTCKALGQSVIEFYYNLMGPIILKSALVLFVLFKLLHSAIEPNYLSIISLVFISLILYTAIMLVTGFKNKELKYLKELHLSRA